MLTDVMVDEEFEIKEEEPWYEKQDLEHDLHLAAKLGKSLLDRNKELEQGLQQIYSTNHEQLQEIDYLTKQVDHLRQVNDQHAKVYEQLDNSSRELEQTNHRLGVDNRAAQQKIHGLTDVIEGLHAQVEDLQRQVDKLKITPTAELSRANQADVWRPQSAQSVSCLKELQNAHRYSDCDLSKPPDDLFMPSKLTWHEEEHASLRRSLRSLQTQLANERARREEAERDADLLANDNAALEQRLDMMEGCQARIAELEFEAEELRQLWRADNFTKATGSKEIFTLLPDAELIPLDEERVMEFVESEGDMEGHRIPKHSISEKLKRASQKDMDLDHERSCVRRSEVVKQRGMSLLNEVDAQYSALQAKYNELLQRCCQGEQNLDNQSHKSIQTPIRSLLTSPTALSCSQTIQSDIEGVEEEFNQPEYKALFKEIFTCIQKTKEDLSENRERFNQESLVQ